MHVVPQTGDIWTKECFGDCQLHLEFACPAEIKGESQGRGNSGVFLMGIYEIQVLDGYNNPTYADGITASIYGEYPPLVNACRKPGEWQTYEVIFTAPRFKDGKLEQSGRLTAFHNGVLILNHVEVLGATAHRALPKYTPHAAALPLVLQSHGCPVRFRNIWIRHLKTP